MVIGPLVVPEVALSWIHGCVALACQEMLAPLIFATTEAGSVAGAPSISRNTGGAAARASNASITFIVNVTSAVLRAVPSAWPETKRNVAEYVPIGIWAWMTT